MSMSATIQLSASGHQKVPPELDPQREGLVYGQGLPYAADDLDAIASAAGARPISEFFDDSEMLSEEEYEEEGMEKPQAKWFDPADGIRTLDTLIAELERRPADSMVGQGRRRVAASDMLWDLRTSRAILATAASNGEQFKYVVG